MPNLSFPVVTLAVWTEQLSQSISDQISTKAIEMAAENKTDNVPEPDYQNPDIEVRRNWVDTSAANEWIAFVQGLGGPLASITIES